MLETSTNGARVADDAAAGAVSEQAEVSDDFYVRARERRFYAAAA